MALKAHLMRRAGFGTTRGELEELAGKSYEDIVEDLLHPERIDDLNEDYIKRFDKYLKLQNPQLISFISGEKIEDDQLSRDHVIPWSYLYSDDIWNIVYVKKTENSSKNNKIPSREMIEKLKIRNKELLKKLEENNLTNLKIYKELEISIKNGYVDKFWNGCR